MTNDNTRPPRGTAAGDSMETGDGDENTGLLPLNAEAFARFCRAEMTDSQAVYKQKRVMLGSEW